MRVQQRSLLVLACALITCARLAAAGCAGEIFLCNDRNLCASTQCPQGLVCRVDNCNGCVAKCEPPNTVHIMSLPGAGPMMGGGSSSSNGAGAGNSKPTPAPTSTSPKVVTEASCPCPRSFMPVCATDGKRYNNKCLAECAGAKATSQQPDSNGNCPKAAGSAGGSTKAPEQPQKQQDKQQAQQEPQPPKNLGFMCRCAQSNTPVCGTDGKYYDSECFAICEGVKASSVKPDQAKKTCNMMQTGSSSSSSGTGPRNMMQQHGQAAPTRPATMQPPPSHSAALATCACPRILSPVCGSDGKLYNNECEAGCRGVVATVEKPDEQGRCPQPRPRPQQKPNSGSSSSSGTSAANANTEAAGNGALQTPPGTTTTPPKPAQPIRRPAGCICPMIWGPVCGSDGKVYDNRCYAECAGVRVTSQNPSACTKAAAGSQTPTAGQQATQQTPSKAP